MTNKILFIGGSGFIGSNLVNYFSQDIRTRIYILDKKNANLNKINEFLKITVISGDIKDVDLIHKTIKLYNINIIVHLVSSLIPNSNFFDYKNEFEKIIFPTISLLKLCVSLDVKFVFFSSGGAIYGDSINSNFTETDFLAPISYYGLSKQIIENEILFEHRSNNLQYLIIRPSNPFGPGQSLKGNQGLIAVIIDKIISNSRLEVWGDGENVRDYIYITDLAESFYKLINKNISNEIINIGFGQGYSINDIVKMLSVITGNKIDLIYKESRKVDVKQVVLNNSKLNSLIDINYTPIFDGITKFYLETIKTLKN